jgi:Bacterial dnaA protein helix-turn-helix
MYVARHHTKASLREIADRMGVRDISTVSHAERRVATPLTEPDVKAKELRQCLKRIYSSIPFHSSLTRPPRPSTAFRPVIPDAAYFLYWTSIRTVQKVNPNPI